MRPAVDRAFERRLSSLINSGEPGILQGGLKGVEKESLRVDPDGRIVHTPHPRALGSALTNEHITTDFSESLIELVTPALGTSWELLQYLCDLHRFVYRQPRRRAAVGDLDAVRPRRATPTCRSRATAPRTPRG